MIEILAHRDLSTFPAGWRSPVYRLHLRATGKLLGYGRDVLRIASMRLAEEAVALAGSSFRLVFDDGRPDQLGVVELAPALLASRDYLAGLPDDYRAFLEMKGVDVPEATEAPPSAESPSPASESHLEPNALQPPPYGF